MSGGNALLERIGHRTFLVAGLTFALGASLVGCDGANPPSKGNFDDGGGNKPDQANVEAADQPKADEGGVLTVDAALPEYKPTAGVSGTIKSVGSDTMNNLMTYWAEGFKKHYPGVTVEVEGKGSNTAMPALVAGTATFGPMSRPAKPEEINEFQKKFGYKPVSLASSIDMLAVFVNKDNPIGSLSVPQIDAMFSKNRLLGEPADIATWGQLGLTGDWENASISLYGRNSSSGTYTYFKDEALGKGDYKDTVKEQPGSSAVVQSVGADRFAAGYSGIGYRTSEVRTVPLSKKTGGKAVSPTPENMADYPLSRALYLIVNHDPTKELDPLRREFIRFVYSKDGQEIVIKDGFLPLSAEQARGALKSVGIEPGF